ncbi:uncharacterized protein LOC144627773 [Crassostrea virginica]
MLCGVLSSCYLLGIKKNSVSTLVIQYVFISATTTPVPTTSTPAPTPTPSPSPPNTTTTSPTTTTTRAPATTPGSPDPHKDGAGGQHFDAASFVGGMILMGGLIVITYFGLKFYRARKDRNYRTL